MIRFTVIWDQGVEVPFIDAWVAGDSQMRATLTELANWLDKDLSIDPDQKGQLREDLGARIIAVELSTSPANVSVTYEVNHADRIVRIIRLTFRS